MQKKILVIDNYDSFVYNLARYCSILGCETEVMRNTDSRLNDEEFVNTFDSVIVSPGPCAPEQAGYSKTVIARAGGCVPILGVCLGHQAICEVYGGVTVRADKPMHGKLSDITHGETSNLFKGIDNPFRAARYHSLVSRLNKSSDLHVTAWTNDIIMAVQHKTLPVFGIQFHPESVLTECGQDIIRNFLAVKGAVRQKAEHKNEIVSCSG
mgnify:CR=1 FL=1